MFESQSAGGAVMTGGQIGQFLSTPAISATLVGALSPNITWAPEQDGRGFCCVCQTPSSRRHVRALEWEGGNL